MITQADDQGRMVVDPDQLRVLVFGYHRKVTAAHVAEALDQLAETGLIRRYAVEGVEYADFPSWRDHQRVEHPTASKLPEYCHSVNPHEPSPNAQELSARIGRDRKGRDQGSNYTVGHESPDRAHTNGFHRDASEILDFLNHKTGRSYRHVAANLLLIEARLKTGATVADCRGVIARKYRQWGADPAMAKFVRPKTLFSAANFENYLGEKETA